MSAHAELSASGSTRWLNCPGSVTLEKDAAPEEESRYAQEGTKAHVLHDLWLNHLIKSPFTFKIPDGYPANMVAAVRVSIDEISAIWKTRKGVLESEKKVSLAHIEDGMFGTLDVRHIEHFGRLYVMDYKHGAGVPVDIIYDSKPGKYNHNTQLIYYALATAHEFNYDFDEIVIGIIQPRCLHHHEGHTRLATLDVETLKAYEEMFRRGVERVRRKNAKRVYGDWCMWCKAKTLCPEYKNANHAKSATAFASAPIEDVL